MLTRRTLILSAAALPLAGCATVPELPATATRPLTLDQAFLGRTRGRGVFVSPIIRSERRFTATLDGRLAGEVLTVAEDFVYDDGETNRLTWVFRRTGPGTWEGKREDTVGVARVVESGSAIRLTYTADFRSGGDVTRLAFSDVIYAADDGSIVNDGIVTRFGLPVGKVRFAIRRP